MRSFLNHLLWCLQLSGKDEQEAGQHSTMVSLHASISSCPEFDPQCSCNFSKEKIADVAEVNQWRCLEESGQWLENVDGTLLVLASGKLSTQHHQPSLSTNSLHTETSRPALLDWIWLMLILLLKVFQTCKKESAYWNLSAQEATEGHNQHHKHDCQITDSLNFSLGNN